MEESQGLCTVRAIAQLMCSRLSGRCVLIGSLFSLAVWRASAEGRCYHWCHSSCEVAWFLALWLCEAPFALSLSLPLQHKARHGQAGSDQAPHGRRRRGAGECDVKGEAQGLIMVPRTENQAFLEVTPCPAWLCGSEMCPRVLCLLILRPRCLHAP